jgi:hypothetical protein
MAATLYAYIARQRGASVVTAFPQVTPNGVGNQNLDLIQIIGQGGDVLLNVDYAGTVHNPASGATNGTRIGQYYSRLTSAATTAQLFADVFSDNESQEDIIQVINVGGNISYYLNYAGVATGS